MKSAPGVWTIMLVFSGEKSDTSSAPPRSPMTPDDEIFADALEIPEAERAPTHLRIGRKVVRDEQDPHGTRTSVNTRRNAPAQRRLDR